MRTLSEFQSNFARVSASAISHAGQRCPGERFLSSGLPSRSESLRAPPLQALIPFLVVTGRLRQFFRRLAILGGEFFGIDPPLVPVGVDHPLSPGPDARGDLAPARDIM